MPSIHPPRMQPPSTHDTSILSNDFSNPARHPWLRHMPTPIAPFAPFAPSHHQMWRHVVLIFLLLTGLYSMTPLMTPRSTYTGCVSKCCCCCCCMLLLLLLHAAAAAACCCCCCCCCMLLLLLLVSLKAATTASVTAARNNTGGSHSPWSRRPWACPADADD